MKTTRPCLPILALALATAFTLNGVALPSAARADDLDHGHHHDHDRDYEHEHESDHDRARRAMQAGEVLPLAEILGRLQSVVPGRVIETELERHDGRYVYDFTLVSPDGRLWEAEMDAATGQLLELEGQD